MMAFCYDCGMVSEKSPSPLDSIRIKLARAEEHLNEVIRTTREYAQGECSIAMEKDVALQMAVQRIRIKPSASPEISAMAGDFFANVRAVLDYIVWQLVLSNPPNEPSASNQFPIANKPSDFADQLARKRLRGVPEKAVTLIEQLQPYNADDNPIGILNRLSNIDKHQTLNVVTVVADNTEIISQAGNFALILGDEELRDGTIFGEIGIPFKMIPMLPDFERRLPEMKMHGKCSLFVAFEDPSAEYLEDFRVDRTLQWIFEFTRDKVIPAFEPFLLGSAKTGPLTC